jgi:four helix bundle protein
MSENKNGRKEIVDRCLNYGVLIIKITDKLPRTPAGFKIAEQLVSSGTSIGANLEEAQEAVSKNDFIHKINISLKECRETIFWLEIIQKSDLLNEKTITPGINEGVEIKKILATIIWKTKQNN